MWTGSTCLLTTKSIFTVPFFSRTGIGENQEFDSTHDNTQKRHQEEANDGHACQSASANDEVPAQSQST